MKTYIGVPTTQGGQLTVVDSATGESKALQPPPDAKFGWGKDLMGAPVTAKAILTDLLGSAADAEKVYRRVMWRTVAAWDMAKSFQVTDAELRSELRDVMASEEDLKRARSQAASEVAPVGDERFRTVYGATSEIVNKG